MNLLTLKKWTIVLLLSFICYSTQAQYLIKGKVLDVQDATPLIGASVIFKKTQKGTFTNQEGKFSLEVPELGGSLFITHVGYQDLEIPVENVQEMLIRLTPTGVDLDEVVVVGYGTQSKRKITNSISSVDQEAFEGVPESNFQAALGGQIAGLAVTQNSGVPGGAVTLRLRGPSSLNADNQPLIVIDGLLVTGLNGFYLGGGGPNPLANLNPGDIASIDVLKDAAASSIYGSQGANGVIIITTKSGKLNSKPRVNLSYFAGYSEPTNTYDLLNGKEYAQLWNQAAEGSGFPIESGLYYDVDKQPSTDWQDLIFQKGFQQMVQAEVSGGGQNTQYFFSGSFQQEDAYYKTKGLKRYSFRVKLDQIINEKIRAGISLAPSRTENRRLSQWSPDSPLNAIAMPPNVEAFDESGRTILPRDELGYPGFSPLINLLENDHLVTNNQILLNTYASYHPIPGLTIRTELATEISQIEEFLKRSSRTTIGSTGNGEGFAMSLQLFNVNWTTTANYQSSFGDVLGWDITLGSNIIDRKTSEIYAVGNNFPSDFFPFLTSAANPVEVFTNRRGNSFAGFFSRVNFALQDKFLLTLSGRVDGSSRFGKNNRYGFFPAASAGWILSEESFIKNLPFSFLKLRTSFGVAGNAGIFDLASISAILPGYTYGDEPASQIVQFANDDLSWEKNVQWDLGLEFELLNNRISGSLGYYVKDTRDLILQVPIPRTSGLPTIAENVGAMRNQGFEFDISAEVLKGDFSWTLNLNGATLKNEVLNLKDNDNDGSDEDIIRGVFLFRPGVSAASFYLIPYAGVDRTNGDALFYDLEGSTTPIASSANRTIVGKSLPDFTGGISQNLRFKGFELSALFQYALGFQIYRTDGEFNEQNMRGRNNQLRSQLQAWTPDNRDTDVPQARLGQANGSQVSSRYLDDGDYLRLKNIQLGYTFPLSSRNSNLTIYIAGQNLLTWTRFPGLDPEVNGLNPNAPGSAVSLITSPQAKKVIIGFHLNL
jgi:TonB-linked SusC/RagA family outer membrane protein